MQLEILELWGVDFGPVDDSYAFIQKRPGVKFYKLIGWFLVDGEEEVDAWVYLSEEQLNTILAHQPITFKLVKNDVAYTVSKTTQEEVIRLNELSYKAEFLGDVVDEEGEEYRIYGLTGLKEKKKKAVR